MAKRQFLWIMSDTTRFDMLSCYGGQDMHTPCLDEMAASGLRFERAYTTQPVCGPRALRCSRGSSRTPTEAGETPCPWART